MQPNNGQVGCTRVVYDGVTLSDTFEVHDLRIPVHPKITPAEMTAAERPGSYFCSRKIATRDIVMKLAVNAGSRCPVDIADAWREVAPLVTKDEPKKLYLGDVYVNAMLIGSTIVELLGYRGAVELTFRAFDPYIYGEEKTVNLAQGDNTVTVGGGEATWPVITATVASGPLTVGNGTEAVVIPDAAGTTVIDMDAQRCTVGGAWRACDPTQTDFWQLQVGTNTVSLSAGSAVMKYIERWL